jgi:pyruvate dehydrogenase E2 component (dihydrolipoamide acetyltransferase)
LASASWRAPNDPQFFGQLDLDAEALLEYARTIRDESGVHVTMTHLISRAVAHGLSATPSLNQRRVRSREYDRESVDVFVIASAGGGTELSGVKVVDADKKSAVELAREVERRVDAIRTGTDPEFGRTKRMLEVLPIPLLRIGIRLSAWLTSDLNLDLPALGLPRQAFGGAMVTSVGMWGVSNAYSPLASFYKVPVLVLIGAVEQRPAVVSGELAIRPMLTLTASFDHRAVDGFQAAQFADAIRDYATDPAAFEKFERV